MKITLAFICLLILSGLSFINGFVVIANIYLKAFVVGGIIICIGLILLNLKILIEDYNEKITAKK